MCIRFLFGVMKILDTGDGCSSVNILKSPPNYVL